MRLGYACINLSLPTRLRTVRLRNASKARVLELARHNLGESVRAARWNAAHGLGLLRLTSDMIPFGSHPGIRSDWREELKEDLAAAGAAFLAAGQRVSTHPGQYSVLNSPRADVVDATLLDLQYHADMLDLMGVPADVVLHVGGAYGDRAAARGRFLDNLARVPARARRRLVLENDDVTWNAGEVLRVCGEAGLPMVFDVFHDQLLPTEGLSPREALAAALATWPAGRRPKVHYSDPAPTGRRGTHGDLVDPAGFMRFVRASRGLPGFDVMVEAKRKEQAVLPLLAALTAAPAPRPRSRRARAPSRSTP